MKSLPPTWQVPPPARAGGRRMLAAVIRSRRVSEAPERRDGAFGAVPPGGPDQNAISENVLPSTKAASPLFQTLTATWPSSILEAAVTAFAPVLELIATPEPMPARVTV